jgi:hypothetical protein
MSLRGTIDVRPFEARSAFARRRSDNGKLDIIVFDTELSPARGCDHVEGEHDTERVIQVQMPWPLPLGTTLRSMDPHEFAALQPTSGTAGVRFSVRRGLGGASQTALGSVVVSAVSASGGTLTLDVASANLPEGVSGEVRGAVPFVLCPAG